jgi:5-bromo-4-chloroindolyl phosphate hydrolysis protein
MANVKRYREKAPEKKRVVTLKGILLYLLPAPLLISAVFAFLRGDASAIISNSIAFALFLLAASLARKGFILEKIYHDSKLSKAPRLPYKTVAALFLAIATFFTSYFCTDNTLILTLLLTLASFGGFYLYYGFDPRKDKLGDLYVGVNAEDIIETLQEAKERVSKLKRHKQHLSNFESKEYLQSIIMETQEIIDNVEENPNDLSRARKFFKVYLHRTEKITQEFVENLRQNNIDDKMVDNYNRLLKSVKETIKEQKEKLNDDDILQLDIQIEALTKQLNHEGV